MGLLKKEKTQQALQGFARMVCGVITTNVDWSTSANYGASGVVYQVEDRNNSGLTMLDNDSAGIASSERV